jgi:hypothetical protein
MTVDKGLAEDTLDREARIEGPGWVLKYHLHMPSHLPESGTISADACLSEKNVTPSQSIETHDASRDRRLG